MRMKARDLAIALAVLAGIALFACTDNAPAPDRKAARAARVKAAELASIQPPRQRIHHMPTGDMVVIDVPVVLYSGFADVQRCFIWRDTEFKTAAMQCPADASAPPLAVPDLPESTPRY